jgi:hypothetical protein
VFSENRSLLFPSALDTIAEEDLSLVLRDHRDTDLYWFFEDGRPCVSLQKFRKHYQVVAISLGGGAHSTFQPLQELNGPAIHCVELARLQRMPSAFPLLSSWLGAYLWKSLASALLYLEVSVRQSSELFFFGHLLLHCNLHKAPLVRQAPPTYHCCELVRLST